MKLTTLVLLLAIPTTLVSSTPCTSALTKEVFPRVKALAGEFTLSAAFVTRPHQKSPCLALTL